MLQNLLVTADPASRTLVFTRDFDAPPDLVFASWTTPEHVRHWWDPTGAPLAVCEIDLRPGGSFRWVNTGDQGKDYPFTGTYREIEPPARLVFAGPGSLVTLRFTPELQGSQLRTKLTITIECQSIEDRDALLARRVDAGTARTLENLAAYLPTIGQLETVA